MSQEPDAPRPDAGPPPGWPTPSVRAPSKTLPGEPVFPSLSGAPTDPGADPFSAHAAENMAFALSQAPPIVAPAGKDGTTVMPAAQSLPKAGTEILLVGNLPDPPAPLPITAQDPALGSTEQASPLALAEAGAIPFGAADAPRMTEAGLPPNFMAPGLYGEPAPIVVGFDGPSATAPGGAPPMAMGPDLGAVVGPPVAYGASHGSSHRERRGASMVLVGLLSALGIAGVATAGVLIHRQQKAASRPDEAPAPTIELPTASATAVVGAAPPVTDLAEPPPVETVEPPPVDTSQPAATAAPATTAAPTATPTSSPTARPTSTASPTAKPTSTGTGTSPTAKPTTTSTTKPPGTTKPPSTSTKPPSGPIVMKPPVTTKPPGTSTGGYKPPPSTTGGYKPPPATTGYKPPKKPIIVMKDGTRD